MSTPVKVYRTPRKTKLSDVDDRLMQAITSGMVATRGKSIRSLREEVRMEAPKKKKLVKTPTTSIRPRRVERRQWRAVKTTKSEGESYVKLPDTEVETRRLLNEIIGIIDEGDSKIRVSQAYEGVGHTYAIRVERNEFGKVVMIDVIDHAGNRIYNAKSKNDRTGRTPLYWQYNTIIDGLSANYDSPHRFVEEKFAEKNADPVYTELCRTGKGPCVYYIDEYIFQKI